MSRRRARRPRRHPVLWTIAVVLLLLAVLHWPALLLLAAVAGLVAGAGYLARWHPVARTAPVMPPAAPVAAPKRLGQRGGARARANRWAPPSNPHLLQVPMSAACAEGSCVFCPGGACQCPLCRHDPGRIAIVNRALYDAAHAQLPAQTVPFAHTDTVPF